MRHLLAWLGILLGFAAARSLDALWVTYWYTDGFGPAGYREAVGPPLLFVVDALGMAVAGAIAGWVGLWLAGESARGIGLWIGLLVLGATGVDALVGIANAPRWHEITTALIMVPAIMLAGGARPRLPRRPAAPNR